MPPSSEVRLLYATSCYRNSVNVRARLYRVACLRAWVGRVSLPELTETTSLDGVERSDALPGSRGEHFLQCALETSDRATRFYSDQVLDHLNPAMAEFVGRMEMAFISTADADGECDSTLRAGAAGFLRVIDSRTVVYPEYRGNGVMASLGNIMENPHVGMLMVDFADDLIGLHVNGRARIAPFEEFESLASASGEDKKVERWVVVTVQEAYVHCRKHIPRMVPVDRVRHWGTDDVKKKGGDFFGVKAGKTSNGND
ncbi:pyridoxamine 5-phosphate oxidase [Lentzea sp. NEAU-D13]|uniref:Pyridoxamine 5-phosphate oxidase n=1 Tax=Lentzea alba TaxID=2714351 RepID=A0A7C9VY96_9PSEU|nr:pyridoxamine 5-phosphate oxidase [Lentzea alba]